MEPDFARLPVPLLLSYLFFAHLYNIYSMLIPDPSWPTARLYRAETSGFFPFANPPGWANRIYLNVSRAQLIISNMIRAISAVDLGEKKMGRRMRFSSTPQISIISIFFCGRIG